jgi:PPOX class probable F420-dependent enzyme
MSVIPGSHADLLRAVTLVNVATVGPDGDPQVNPVWFDWDGTHLNISQTTSRQKYRNVQREPRVAVSIIDPVNPHRYLEIRGTVVAIDPDEDGRFVDALARRYLGVERFPMHEPGDERVIIRIRPDRVSQGG